NQWARLGCMTAAVAAGAVLVTGTVLAAEATRHEAQSMEKTKVSLTETRASRRCSHASNPPPIQNAPTSLTRAIATAETRAGGKPVQATVKRDGAQLQSDIDVVKDAGTTEKLKINGSPHTNSCAAERMVK